ERQRLLGMLAGRPDPAADVAWLQANLPAGADPVELCPFYLYGRKVYQERRDDLLKLSMEGTHEWLNLSAGPLGSLSRSDRAGVILDLMRANPPQNPDYVLHHGDVLRPLSHLDEIVNLPGPRRNGIGIGPFASVQWEESPPASRLTFQEAVADYLGHLHRITHATGRRSHAQEWSDDHSAWNCVRLEQNFLHRDPDRVALFRELVSFYQSPWQAIGVLVELECVRPEDRREVRTRLEEEVTARRERDGWPQDHLEATGEGDTVERLVKQLSLASKVRQPRESLDDALEQLTLAVPALGDDLGRYYPRQALEAAAAWRGPGEPLRQGVERLLEVHSQVRELESSDHPWDLQRDLRLLEGLGRHRQDPQFGDELRACLDHLQQARPEPGQGGPFLVAAFQRRREEETPLQALQRFLQSWELTGTPEGLEEVRSRIAAALSSGQLEGTREEWMDRFSSRVLEIRLLQDDRARAAETALREILEFRDPGRQIGDRGNFLVVGGVRVRRKR
ncbi:MAG: hypothetical protein AB1758_38315, partial [Candidatus Eremiobacterota bacterium]